MQKLRTKSYTRHFDGRVPPPETAAIETTRYCNLKCRMCIQFLDGTTVTGPHMDMEDFERVAESVFPFVKQWQPSLSGEPLVSKGFLKMLDIAHAFGVKSDIVTNGTLLKDSMIESLVPGLGRIAFSIDGSEKETFEDIREGANFESTMERIKKLVCASKAHFPPDEQPIFGVRATIMEQNIRNLPDLVAYSAEELQVDVVTAVHVFPASDEMKKQSLVHHIDLARRCIDEAFGRARKHGIKLEVMPLDQIIAATAVIDGSDRELATRDGVVEGLEFREWSPGPLPPIPGVTPRHDDYKGVMRRRSEALAKACFPEPVEVPESPPQRESIWWCDYLWNRTYIHIGGDVKPCCIYGAPTLGNIRDEPFTDIWNNDDYRAFRQKLAMKDPMPSCKGCASIHEVSDPQLIHKYLLGTEVPVEEVVAPVSPGLSPDIAEGYWLGEWSDAGRRRQAVLRIERDGDRWKGQFTEPSVGIPWIDLENVNCSDRYVTFFLALEGERVEVKGRVDTAGSSLCVTVFKATGEQLAEFGLKRVQEPGEVKYKSRWRGHVQVGSANQPVSFDLGTFNGKPVGFFRLPELLGDQDYPLLDWFMDDGTVVIHCDLLPSVGGRLHLEGTVSEDETTAEGSCWLGESTKPGSETARFSLGRREP